MPSDGNPSFYHLWAVMDFHPKSLVMDIHAPSRLIILSVYHLLQFIPSCTQKKSWRVSGNVQQQIEKIYLHLGIFNTEHFACTEQRVNRMIRSLTLITLTVRSPEGVLRVTRDTFVPNTLLMS